MRKITERYRNYIIGYEFEDDRIRIISSNGRTKYVANNKKNMQILNKTIVKSKVDIARHIDEYTASFKTRCIELLLCMFVVIASGTIAITSFFMGSYLYFLAGIFVFSLGVMSTSIVTFNYFTDVIEIRHLKKLTGYKQDLEIELPKLKVNMFTK